MIFMLPAIVFYGPAFCGIVSLLCLPVSMYCIFLSHGEHRGNRVNLNRLNAPLSLLTLCALYSNINIFFFQKHFQIRDAYFFIVKQACSQGSICACIKYICKMLHTACAAACNYRNR